MLFPIGRDRRRAVAAGGSPLVATPGAVRPYYGDIHAARLERQKTRRELGWTPSVPTYRQGCVKVAASCMIGPAAA